MTYLLAVLLLLNITGYLCGHNEYTRNTNKSSLIPQGNSSGRMSYNISNTSNSLPQSTATMENSQINIIKNSSEKDWDNYLKGLMTLYPIDSQDKSIHDTVFNPENPSTSTNTQLNPRSEDDQTNNQPTDRPGSSTQQKQPIPIRPQMSHTENMSQGPTPNHQSRMISTSEEKTPLEKIEPRTVYKRTALDYFSSPIIPSKQPRVQYDAYQGSTISSQRQNNLVRNSVPETPISMIQKTSIDLYGKKLWYFKHPNGLIQYGPGDYRIYMAGNSIGQLLHYSNDLNYTLCLQYNHNESYVRGTSPAIQTIYTKYNKIVLWRNPFIQTNPPPVNNIPNANRNGFTAINHSLYSDFYDLIVHGNSYIERLKRHDPSKYILTYGFSI
ncbi:hypothetical protein NEOKW01_0390 [Nematocida sp. AWRm80]|nr:hypothetical protein NEOKW01_0390 [Nematocida sp. AWRm80]